MKHEPPSLHKKQHYPGRNKVTYPAGPNDYYLISLLNTDSAL